MTWKENIQEMERKLAVILNGTDSCRFDRVVLPILEEYAAGLGVGYKAHKAAHDNITKEIEALKSQKDSIEELRIKAERGSIWPEDVKAYIHALQALRPWALYWKDTGEPKRLNGGLSTIPLYHSREFAERGENLDRVEARLWEGEL